ncbi:type II toxin-antitoxin system CcdA family antitoxin [Falsiroseomonas bella]|nr:type II toxin-antitoxin system CcdA family antitoxin [Falsiroseomonas bella]
MGHEGKAKRQAVNLSLPADLVQRARACTGNLSGTVEELLSGFVAREEARRRDEDERLARTLDALNAMTREHGTFGDDLSRL